MSYVDVQYDDRVVLGKPAEGVLPSSFPFWATVFYMAMFVIRPWETLVPELAAFRVERLIGIAMIAIAFLGGRRLIRFDRQSIAVLAFFGSFLLCGWVAVDPSRAGESLYVYATLVVMYFVLMAVIASPYDLVFLLGCYVLILGLYFGKAQWEYFVHGAGRYDMGVHRLAGIEGTFGYPNSVAASAVYSLPILWFLYSVRRDFCANWRPLLAKCYVGGLAVYAILAVTTIFLTRSRAGALSLAAFLLLIAFRRAAPGKRLMRMVIAAIVIVVAFILLPSDMQNRIRTLWDPSAGPASAEASAEGRREGFLAGLAMFRDHPLTGVGPGNFLSYRTARVDGVTLSAHSLAGECLGETGLLGTAAFLLLVGVIFHNAYGTYRLTRDGPDPTSRVLSQWALAGRDVILLLLLNGFAGHNLMRFNWLWVAAFCALTFQFASDRAAQLGEARSWPRPLGPTVL